MNWDFLRDLGEAAFLRNALWAGLLASFACGVVGSYVVVRRITYIAGSVSHCVLGGLGAARYLQVTQGWEWLDPIYGAFAAALLAAGIIGCVSLRARQREDTVIGAVWAVGMAIGIIFIFKTPGYQADLNSYLFGNILLVARGDLFWIAALNLTILLCVTAFYNPFLAVCFDEGFARLRGVNTEAYYLLLLALTAITVVVLVKVVGIILAIALLTLPAAIASNLSRSLTRIMIMACLLCAFFTSAGLAFSYQVDLPTGATIIVLAGATYLATAVAGIGRRA